MQENNDLFRTSADAYGPRRVGRDPTPGRKGPRAAYKPLTHIEPHIPLVFAVLYVVLALVALASTTDSSDSTTTEVTTSLLTGASR